MTHSYPKSASVSYNVSGDLAVDELTRAYGDFLERIDTIDKVGLLAILALWQHADSVDVEGVCLEDAECKYSEELSEALCCAIEGLDGISDAATFNLMVAIANQLVSEQN